MFVSRIVAKQLTSKLQQQAPKCWNVAATRHFTVTSPTAQQLQTTFDLPDPSAETEKFQLTKIVATVGPTSEQLEPLQKVVKAGMKIMRLNFSHATTDEVELRLKNLALSQVSEG